MQKQGFNIFLNWKIITTIQQFVIIIVNLLCVNNTTVLRTYLCLLNGCNSMAGRMDTICHRHTQSVYDSILHCILTIKIESHSSVNQWQPITQRNVSQSFSSNNSSCDGSEGGKRLRKLNLKNKHIKKPIDTRLLKAPPANPQTQIFSAL